MNTASSLLDHGQLWKLGKALLLSGACFGCQAELPGAAGKPPTLAPGSGGAATGGTGATAQDVIAPSVVRRLTRREYNNTLRDLLGDASQPSKAFLPDEELLGFDNIAAVQTVSPVLTEQYLLAAEQVSKNALPALSTSMPCTISAKDAVCAESVIRELGQRAWRRPLAAPELQRILGVFQLGNADGGFDTGLSLAIQALLISAPFIFRIELGEPALELPGRLRPTPWEMASRLSYLILGSMPDSELFAAAAGGALTTADQVRSQALRLIADARARDAVSHFHSQWLRLSDIEPTHVQKDVSVYPEHSEALLTAMRRETELFVADAFWSQPAGLSALLTSSTSFVDAPLAAFYGVSGPAGPTLERVTLDPNQRPGLLTRAGILSLFAHTDGTSPTQRGKFVRMQLLCQTLPPPPPDVDTTLPKPTPNQTTRERVALHKEDPACAGCHELLDPIGLGLEHYDGMGRFRGEEGGRPIDASGALLGADFASEAFVGAAELAQKLATSDVVRSCAVKQWFRYAYGRAETEADAVSVEALTQSFKASGDNFPELLLALTQTPVFLYRPTPGAPL